ncbi:hypothetical protein COCON_G00131340 [Conger conger]|uniref:Uncharacterized protein n=1 Tax=Conger conger TaxID=82655 RepID=A0A9Q1DDV8_CONCO|nr:hypothetical protein COCON_G00131340 [Conger conger]
MRITDRRHGSQEATAQCPLPGRSICPNPMTQILTAPDEVDDFRACSSAGTQGHWCHQFQRPIDSQLGGFTQHPLCISGQAGTPARC